MEVDEQIYTRYEQLEDFCRGVWDEKSLNSLQHAFRFSLQVIQDSRFETGEIILNHSLDVAMIVAEEIGLEPDSVIAGLLHNILYSGLETKISE
ncbi:MAG: hypothetical protein ACOCVA_06845, partial [Prolixibacteraceae bacterium]